MDDLVVKTSKKRKSWPGNKKIIARLVNEWWQHLYCFSHLARNKATFSCFCNGSPWYFNKVLWSWWIRFPEEDLSLMLGKGAAPPDSELTLRGPATPGRIVSITLPSSHCWHILAAGLPLMECVLQLGIRSSVIHLIVFYELGSDTKEWSGLMNRSFPWSEGKKGVDAIVNNKDSISGKQWRSIGNTGISSASPLSGQIRNLGQVILTLYGRLRIC